MTTQIIFRAKAAEDYAEHKISKGDWVYGLFYKDIDTANGAYRDIHYMVTERGDSYVHVLIDIYTLGMWGGEEDRDGNMIFEGDYLYVHYVALGEKCYALYEYMMIKGLSGYKFYWKGIKKGPPEIQCHALVVGNSHDNTEKDIDLFLEAWELSE